MDLQMNERERGRVQEMRCDVTCIWVGMDDADGMLPFLSCIISTYAHWQKNVHIKRASVCETSLTLLLEGGESECVFF